MRQLIQAFPQWFLLVGSLFALVVLTLLAADVFFTMLRKLRGPMLSPLLRRLHAPSRWFAAALIGRLVLPALPFTSSIESVFAHLFEVAAIVAGAWFAISVFDAWRELLALRYPLEAEDNLRARQIHTQVQILRRIALALILLLAVGAALMTFPQVRALGTTLFASAGAAGLLVGLAARPAISNLLAGLQVALSEPIRLDDVVIVQGEWGRVEEIRTTYVVVRIWDNRRLIVPLSYFIEQPFQNWTRRSADLLGTVYLYADYTLPVEAVRRELHDILQATPLWDGKSWSLQVTDATAQTIELRALMSAANSSQCWDLRCLVREKLIAFLQTNHPQCLPRTRVELPPAAGTTPPQRS